MTNLGPPAHLSIFLPHREHLSECTELPCVRLAEIYGRFDGIALLVRLTVSHLFPPWTRRHHSTNSDLIHAKLLCIHQENITYRDSEEPSSHITPCILHTACKRQNFCDQITFWVCSSLVNFASFTLSKNTSTCKTSGVFDLVATWPKSSNSEFDSFWRIVSSQEFLNFHSGQFYFTLAFPLNNFGVLLHLLTGQAYLLLDLVAISDLSIKICIDFIIW